MNICRLHTNLLFLSTTRFGRLPTMMGLVFMVTISGTISAFSPSYELFLCCIYLCGFSAIGFGTVSFSWHFKQRKYNLTLIMWRHTHSVVCNMFLFAQVMYCWMIEILSGREKTIFGVAPHLNFAVWGLGVALIAYIMPEWRHMQLVFSLPLLLLVALYWYLPESPR